ncbi:PrsW family intramembrane metalloprotease [Parafannyhessea umbonata]|uniref:PrsW family intramembrane metalloprotease n=1 Tax=Parafannyhessea umbonata TaxID=604330 RepID=UPI00359C84C0
MFFLFSNGLTLYLAIFLALAVGPAVALVRYVYNLDALEREPVGLLLALFWRGVVAALVASVLEQVGMEAFGLLSGLGRQDPWFLLLSDFAVVGVIEEACKYVLMARATWHDPNFDCRYDGVVYAAAENVTYGLASGPGVLLGRAMMAIPAHMGFAVVFGFLYGEAKLLSVRGHRIGAGLCVACGYLLSVLLHGLYDSTATLFGNGDATFLLVVAVIYLIVFPVVHTMARHDRRFLY